MRMLIAGIGVVGVMIIAIGLICPPGYLPEMIPLGGVILVGMSTVTLCLS